MPGSSIGLRETRAAKEGGGARLCGGTGRTPKRGGIFALTSFFQRLICVCCCFTDSTYRPILLLCSTFGFQLVLGLTPILNPNIRTVWTWNPCSPYTAVTLVALALLIFINIVATGATDIG